MSISFLDKFGDCFQCGYKNNNILLPRSHKKVYFEFFGIGFDERVMSELSGAPAVDVHAIQPTGRGGKIKEELIENLIAITRDEHNDFGGKKDFKEWLYYRHLRHILSVRPDYEIHKDYVKYLDFNVHAWANS